MKGSKKHGLPGWGEANEAMHRMSGIDEGLEFGCELVPLLGDFGRSAASPRSIIRITRANL
jgi:hypothetical protein